MPENMEATTGASDIQEAGAVYPTLYIGLGGTGKEVLFRLRRRFYERWRRPKLDCTRFLWLDTDNRNLMVFGEKIKEMDLEVQFAPHEVIPLLSESVGKDFTDYFRNKDSRAYKHIARWLHPEVEDFGQDIGEGAGGVRSVSARI